MSALLLKFKQFINSIYSGIIFIRFEPFRSQSVYMKIQLLCVGTEFQTYSFECQRLLTLISGINAFYLRNFQYLIKGFHLNTK